jgi:hypothetical protein
MNTSTKVGVYNMALAAIGVSRFVNSTTEGSQQSIVCNLFWDSAYDQVLQDYPWGFAMTYAALQEITGFDIPLGWAYAYTYPSDCIQARRVLPTIPVDSINDLSNLGFLSVNVEKLNHIYKRIPYQIVSNDNTGLAIVTNLPNAVLEYTARIETLALWTPAAINALYWLLASKIVSPLAANPKFAETAGKAYEAALLKAGSLTLNESAEKQLPESELITVRD